MVLSATCALGLYQCWWKRSELTRATRRWRLFKRYHHVVDHGLMLYLALSYITKCRLDWLPYAVHYLMFTLGYELCNSWWYRTFSNDDVEWHKYILHCQDVYQGLLVDAVSLIFLYFSYVDDCSESEKVDFGNLEFDLETSLALLGPIMNVLGLGIALNSWCSLKRPEAALRRREGDGRPDGPVEKAETGVSAANNGDEIGRVIGQIMGQ